jgi:hypothetical protein
VGFAQPAGAGGPSEHLARALSRSTSRPAGAASTSDCAQRTAGQHPALDIVVDDVELRGLKLEATSRWTPSKYHQLSHRQQGA